MSSLGGSIYQFPGQHSSLTLTWLEWLLFLKGTYCLKAFVITHDLCIHSTKKRHAQRHVILSFLKLGLSAEVHRLVQTCILTQDVISSHIWHLCIHVEQLIRKLSIFFLLFCHNHRVSYPQNHLRDTIGQEYWFSFFRRICLSSFMCL